MPNSILIINPIKVAFSDFYVFFTKKMYDVKIKVNNFSVSCSLKTNHMIIGSMEKNFAFAIGKFSQKLLLSTWHQGKRTQELQNGN